MSFTAQAHPLAQFVRGLLGPDASKYIVRVDLDDEEDEEVEDGEPDADPKISIVIISTPRKNCFHMAFMHADSSLVQVGKDICAQAVLYRSSADDAKLFHAVFNTWSNTMYFCSLDPHAEEYESLGTYAMGNRSEAVATLLREYVASNAEVLSTPGANA